MAGASEMPSSARLPEVVIPDDTGNSYANSDDLQRLKAVAHVQIFSTTAANESELLERVRPADVILTFRPAFTRFPGSIISNCPRLRLISVSGTGIEDVDVATATSCGVAVANIVGAANRGVAELCLAMMLDLARHVSAQDRDMRAAKWLPRQGIEIAGRTLGIVGLSGIGKELAGIGTALGMEVLSWSRNNDPDRAAAAGCRACPLDELLELSDFVSLHLRLDRTTAGFIGTDQLARMKPGAMLINSARADLVDEAALVAALSSGRLAGAGFDVYNRETLPAGHPLVGLDNVVFTGVSGWNTADASRRMISWSIDNVVGFLTGNPINIVNADYEQDVRRGI